MQHRHVRIRTDTTFVSLPPAATRPLLAQAQNAARRIAEPLDLAWWRMA
jgi:hypothetical protein